MNHQQAMEDSRNRPASDLNHSARVYSNDAIMMCGRRDFQLFLGTDDLPEAERAVRWECGVHSLLDIQYGRMAGFKWEELMQDFIEHVETEKAKANK